MRYCRAAPVSRVLEQGTDKRRDCRSLGEHDQASGRVAKDLAFSALWKFEQDRYKVDCVHTGTRAESGGRRPPIPRLQGISLLLNGLILEH